MTITNSQYEEIRLKMLAYSYRFQHEGRGPSCRQCLRVAEGHAGMDRPVCLTVGDLLAEIAILVAPCCEGFGVHGDAHSVSCTSKKVSVQNDR